MESAHNNVWQARGVPRGDVFQSPDTPIKKTVMANKSLFRLLEDVFSEIALCGGNHERPVCDKDGITRIIAYTMPGHRKTRVVVKYIP